MAHVHGGDDLNVKLTGLKAGTDQVGDTVLASGTGYRVDDKSDGLLQGISMGLGA
jgi:hypothetical protein